MLALIRTLTPLRMKGCSSSRRQAPRKAGGIVRVAVEEHGAKLVATDPDQDVRVAQRAGEPWAELAEQLVPGRVAEGVVDLLEVVEVDEEKGQRAGRGRRVGVILEVGIEHGGELAPVAEPGELVGDGLTVALLGERAQPAHREREAQSDHDERRARRGRSRPGTT